MTFEYSRIPTNTLNFEDLNLNDRYDLLDSLPKTYQVGVEIGVWQGWYTAHLVQRTSMHIVGIDPWVATDSYEDLSDKEVGSENFDPFAKGNDGYLWQEARYLTCTQGLRKLPIDKWSILRGYSYNLKYFFEDQSIDFVYIDGEHSYEAVSQDIADWWPKIKPGGILAGHDYNDTNPGSIQAVDEFAEKSGVEFKITGTSPEKGDADAPSWVFIKTQ
jgi:hypothetical protein|tara:strand:- start:1360 stop:2010 length:651 start_codon:yes stop_codon:yes gene_type:complete